MLGIQCTVEQPSVDHVRNAFVNHINEYGISYGTKEEFEYRFQVYLENDRAINELNGEPNSFVVAHNKFSTLTKDEFKKYHGRMMPSNMSDAREEELDTSVMAATVDWRAKGAVNKVQDQGSCGSCWAFSSIAAMEGSHFIQKGELVKLSEQQLVDCSKKQGNEGCNGGLEVFAFKYAEQTAIELETDYPYKSKSGRKEKCKAVKAKELVSVTDYVKVPKKKVAQMKAAVAKQPVCVSVDADNDVFQFYNKGIMDSKKCGHKLDHAVTAVGYGSQGDKEYLIVRNSWGADWGERGYFRIAIDEDGDGVCGVLMDSSRPTTD
jgi:C1A family cysteine protease